MKKILALVICLVIITTCLVSCGNKAIFNIGEFSFKHIHFTDMTKGHCATVEKWYDNAEGCEVKTTEFGSIYCSEGSYILFEDASKCPYCH